MSTPPELARLPAGSVDPASERAARLGLAALASLASKTIAIADMEVRKLRHDPTNS